MKKILALVLAFAMMFSTITVAFAEAEISAEAKALATVGMLAGDGNGVTVEYTAKEMTRLTAAASLLKLKGLYNDAIAYKSEDNFADVKDYAWAEGKNLMAYLKANPALGFGGNEKGEFNPGGNINEQSYYKVLLETLGYKQNVGEVVGDFTWDETLAFAEKAGLKPAKAEKFTVDELAKATVAALNAKMKDGKVFINVLVDGGKVDKEKAIAAGLYKEAALTANLKSAVGIGNTVVEVTFDAAVEKAAAEKAENYSIEGLEVKSAMLDGTKKVLLETAAQKAGAKYTLVVGDVKVNFGGKAKVTGAPELKAVTGADTEAIELEFDKVLDFASATNTANYAIANVTVEKAELNADRNVVTLTTKGLTAHKTYTVKVTNIKSVDGIALKSASKSFYAKSDKNAPKLEKVVVGTYTRIIAVFNEELDEESAVNVANYTIKAGSSELAIEKIEYLGENDDDKYEVEITTAAQKQGTAYELVVTGVKDDSILKNEITKAQKIRFTGKMQDKNAPTLGETTVITRNMVMVTFNDASRMNFDSLKDIANYEFNKDVTVEKVEMLPGYDTDTKTVLVHVSDLAEKTIYKLTVVGVNDEYGNEIKKSERSINYINSDLNAAKIVKVYSDGSNAIKVVFDKHLDPVTAEDVFNYSINGDLGTPISAKYKKSSKTVTLKTNTQVEGKSYTLKVNGVSDLAGNVLNYSNAFVARTFANDIDAPEIQDITVVNNKVMRITFTEPVVVSDSIKAVVKKANGDDFATFDVKAVYDDNEVLEFSTGANFQNIEYKLVSFNGTIKDKAGNISKPEEYNFWGDNSKPEDIEFSWEQTNVNTYKFTFTEKVKPLVGNMEEDDIDDLDMDTVWYWTKTVRPGAKAFEKDINGMFAGGHAGILIANEDGKAANGITIITADLTDEDAPYITGVKAVDRSTVEVTYDEELKSTGSYSIRYYDINGKEKYINGVTAGFKASTDNKVVKLTLGTTLESRFEYILKVTTEVRDLAGNPSEKNQEYYFQGTDLVPAGNYVRGADIVNGQNITVVMNQTTAIEEVIVSEKDANGNYFVIPSRKVLQDGRNVKVFLTNTALRKGVTYKVTADGMAYEFEGTVSDSVSSYVDNGKYVLSYDNMKVNDTVLVNGVAATGKVVNKEVEFTVAVADAGEKVNTIAVMRDGLVIYFYVDEDAEAIIVPVEPDEEEPTVIAEAVDVMSIGIDFCKVVVTVENLEGAAEYTVAYKAAGTDQITAKTAIGQKTVTIPYNETITVTVYNAAGEALKTFENVNLVK